MPAVVAPLEAPDPTLKSVVASRRHPWMRWGDLRDVAPVLGRAYEATGWRPLWLANGAPTAAARAMVRVLGDAEAHGLRPADYDAAALAERLDAIAGSRVVAVSGAAADPEREPALFDAALTAGVARYATAIRLGRVRPTDLHAELKLPRDTFDVAGPVRALAAAAEPSAILAGLEPPYLHYRLLVRALGQYRALARDTSLLPVGLARTLMPGDTASAVPRLRRLLAALGDLPAGAVAPTAVPETAPADSFAYDSALVAAVRRFQRRQGYDADGIVGPATRTRLDRPFEARAEQIALTLERWRWLPHQVRNPPIFVNVPAFRLHGFRSADDTEASLLSMDVVVGDAYESRTPVFSAMMRTVVFAPYWEIPPGILHDEILPNARRDLSYLTRNRYQIVRGYGDDVPVLPDTRRSLDEVSAGRARIRQLPGPTNSLGLVKFLFPNAHAVYLHDTPAQSAFDRTRRDLSHGCIRLAEPMELAKFVLRDRPEWTEARMKEAMAKPRPTNVTLKKPIPVLIVYATAVAKEDGEMLFYDDIYGHDRRMTQVLARGYPYTR